MEEKMLQELVETVVASVLREAAAVEQKAESTPSKKQESRIAAADGGGNPYFTGECVVEEGEVPDLSAVNFRKVISVPEPAHPQQFRDIRPVSAARIGIWRSGPRYRTESYLRCRADHAAAMDAVAGNVNEDLLKELGLKQYQTLCQSKEEYLTRPDLGRQYSIETLRQMKNECTQNPEIQIIIADGLSSTAVERNVSEILPSLMQGLNQAGVTVGTPFFVKYGRVGAMDPVTELLKAQVTINLIGERPGLVNQESLSAYMTYGGYPGMPETNRTVISNISMYGTNPMEAGAYIADLAVRMLQAKASGANFTI